MQFFLVNSWDDRVGIVFGWEMCHNTAWFFDMHNLFQDELKKTFSRRVTDGSTLCSDRNEGI